MNAANRELAPGAGVCGAIHRAGGASIFEEAARLGPCDTGDARATSAGDLPNRFVIHAVGPIFTGADGDAELLASCHRRAVEEAAELGCRSIAFPAISTGIYGYPIDEAAPIAIASARSRGRRARRRARAVRAVLRRGPGRVRGRCRELSFGRATRSRRSAPPAWLGVPASDYCLRNVSRMKV